MHQLNLNHWSLDSSTDWFLSFLVAWTQTGVLKSVDFHKNNRLTSVSDSKVLGGTNMKKMHLVLSFLNWIASSSQNRFLFFSPVRTPSWLFNSSHCKSMKHWWKFSCSLAYATAIVGHDQQDASFPAEMHFCQHRKKTFFITQMLYTEDGLQQQWKAGGECLCVCSALWETGVLLSVKSTLCCSIIVST